MTARVWLAAHLPWFIITMLVLWVPPFAFLIGVVSGLLPYASTGYPALTDPAVVLTAAQLALMGLAMTGLHRRPRTLKLLFAALIVGWLQAFWMLAVQARLSGAISGMANAGTIRTLVALSLASAVLVALRPLYSEAAEPAGPYTSSAFGKPRT